jgi:ATP-dependent DNA helicase RecG
MRSVLSLGLRELLNGRVESERLELKATGSEACVDAALRTICAFANDVHQRNGGYVVFGVEEAEGQPVLPAQGL